MKKNQPVTIALIAAASIIFGMVVAGGLNLTLPGRAQEGSDARPLHAATRAQMSAGQAGSNAIPASFSDIAERVNPAVVSITSAEKVRSRGRLRERPPFQGDPFEFFFGPEQRRSPHDPDEPRFEYSGGSGFLISDDGYILTNYHVVEDASRIRVKLSGDRREHIADVIGSDPSTDLALIKIKSESRLPVLPLGDSEAIKVGDWVLAVGNPLNYDHTVTVGVVSAKGRKLNDLSRDFTLDSFIQTDAAINFGNSGGPLVNLAGEVIGVNTAISSVGQGIGFAVPINVAREIMGQLKSKGRVSRGYLGIDLHEIDPDLQEAFGLASDKGALVQVVRPGLPAEEAGVQKGDVIVKVDGRPVATSDEVVRLITAKEPGSSVRLTVIRGGKEITLTARLADRAEHLPSLARRSQAPGEPGEDPKERRLGIAVKDLTPQILRELGLPADTRGIMVADVSRVSEAYEKQIGEGDVITEVNRTPITSVSEYRREIRKVKEGGLVVFYVISPPGRTGGDPISRYVTVRLQEGE